MKTNLVVACIFPLLLSACASAVTPVAQAVSLPAAASELLTATPAVSATPGTGSAPVCQGSPAPLSSVETDYVDPDPTTWVMLMKPVREYFYYRKKAVVSGDIQALWNRYPPLSQGVDVSRGWNSEAFLVQNMRPLGPFDGDISIESYEQIKVIVSDTRAAVLTHGLEMYLTGAQGQFDESGSEFKIIVFVCELGDQSWTVYGTHDITPP